MAKEIIQMFEKIEKDLKFELENFQKNLVLEVQGYQEKLDEDLEYELNLYTKLNYEKLEKEKEDFRNSLEYKIKNAHEESIKLENNFLNQKLMILEKLKEIVVKG